MDFHFEDWGLWAALVGASVGTYVCRAIGVLLSGRINQNSEIFRWLAAVTYAMMAALIVRLIFLPVGLLATVPLWMRILICALSFGLPVLSGSNALSATFYLRYCLGNSF